MMVVQVIKILHLGPSAAGRHVKGYTIYTSRHEEMTSEKIYSYFCHLHQSHQDTQGQRLPNKNPVFCKSSALRQWGCMDVGPVLL